MGLEERDWHTVEDADEIDHRHRERKAEMGLLDEAAARGWSWEKDIEAMGYRDFTKDPIVTNTLDPKVPPAYSGGASFDYWGPVNPGEMQGDTFVPSAPMESVGARILRLFHAGEIDAAEYFRRKGGS